VKKWVTLAGLMVVIGCSFSCDGGGTTWSPLANVAGSWDLIATNPGSATLVECSGDLSTLEGLTLETVVLANPVTCNEPPILITQSGNSFTVNSAPVTCSDGTGGNTGGGGTVDGNSVSGQIETSWNAGWVNSLTAEGAAVGTLLRLDLTRLTYSGNFQGECLFKPRVNLLGTISRAAASEGAGVTLNELGAAVAAYSKEHSKR